MPGGRSKYVVCNADEGDPGAFMDRSVLESDPHRVLEGMAIAAYAVGAEPGLHLRPRRVSRWPSAGSKRPSARPGSSGCSGSQIFESPFNFRVDLRIGAGAFVCGEETALIASIEGRRGDAAAPPALPRRGGPLGQPDADQQRRDVRQRPADHPQRGRVVRRDRHREEQGDQGLRAGRQGPQHRPGRGADGDHAARDRRGDRRRRPGRRHDQGGADRRARRAAASPPRHSTRRSTTSRSTSSARSWARAA